MGKNESYEDEEMTVELELEDGTVVNCAVITILTVEAKDYICLLYTSFFKVVFPDILPGILSGFLMAFTMSLDDFIITHFTKGPGVDTLSTKIYRQGLPSRLNAHVLSDGRKSFHRGEARRAICILRL